ncbi:hypothetical protein IV500_05925 [Paeniglutamicibacter antarcticus]|uniref:Lipoprotein n=1 Tax=Arthrobacter terrae TaxID=2935737 RepID=A0A931CM23_9MICC|nr:hypothetical protein [Arthrobacter terrae]MBG0738960.1 hypothetical protein [Arthrobacter terrae]
MTTLLLAAALAGCAGPATTATSPTPTPSPSVTASMTTAPVVSKATVTPTPTLAARVGIKYSLHCRLNNGPSVTFTDFRAAWSAPYDSCIADTASGTPSAEENAAGALSGGKSPDTAKYLYSLCATTAGHYFEGTVSAGQSKEIEAALMLCPNHPKRAQLEASSGAGQSLAADRVNGKLAYTGKYLVGKDIQPGTWQSQGDKVENCYWEISDAQGNIIANNLISVAPQFTITIPATASGFTVNGCGFRWISD